MKRFVVQGGLLAVTAIAACSSSGGTGTGGTSSSTGGGASSSSTSASSSGAGGMTTSSSSSSTSASSASSTSSSGTGGTGGTPACPTCVVVATLPTGAKPAGIDADANNVFWTNSGTGEVMQIKKDGTSSIKLTTGEDTPIAVHVVGGQAYWVSYSVSGIMRRTPVGGGTITDLVAAPASRDLAITPTTIFWTREPDDIQSIPIDGIADAAAAGLLTNNPLSQGIVFDGTSIYYADRQTGDVKKADPDFGNETPLANGDVPYEVVVDATNIYWTEQGSAPNIGKVMKASKADGSGATQLATMQATPQGIAVDATNVYWVNKDDGTVNKVPIAGGAVTTIAKGQMQPWDIVVDGTHAYWTNHGGDTIVKAPK